MARFGSVSSESLSRRNDPISPGLSSLLRADGNAYPGTSRADVLLGTTPPQHISQSLKFESESSIHTANGDDDLVELKEEDIWAADTGESWFGVTEGKEVQETDAQWPKGLEAKESPFPECKDKNRGSYDENACENQNMMKAGTGNNRMRIGLDRERGLSAALADPGPGLNSLSFSPASWTQLSSRESTPGRLATPSRKVPQPGLSSAFEGSKQLQQQSAPVNVPDWTKILRIVKHEDANGTADGDEDDDEERLPPHE
eukprot:c18788_g1_i1 orf=345-1118(+)